MTCITTKDNEVTRLHFQGAILVSEIVITQKEIISALSSCDHIVMDFGEATELDTAGVQLLFCTANSAFATGKHVEITNFPRSLRKFVDRIGLKFEGIVDRWEDMADG